MILLLSVQVTFTFKDHGACCGHCLECSQVMSTVMTSEWSKWSCLKNTKKNKTTTTINQSTVFDSWTAVFAFGTLLGLGGFGLDSSGLGVPDPSGLLPLLLLGAPSRLNEGSIEAGLDLRNHWGKKLGKKNIGEKHNWTSKIILQLRVIWGPYIKAAASCPETSPSFVTVTLRDVSVLLIVAELSGAVPTSVKLHGRHIWVVLPIAQLFLQQQFTLKMHI